MKEGMPSKPKQLLQWQWGGGGAITGQTDSLRNGIETVPIRPPWATVVKIPPLRLVLHPDVALRRHIKLAFLPTTAL